MKHISIKARIILISYLTLILMLSMGLSHKAEAQDSYSIAVSCSIPAVPGLNAPIVEEETMEPMDTKQNPGSQQEETKIELAEMIRETKEEKILKAQDENSSTAVTLQTVYSR